MGRVFRLSGLIAVVGLIVLASASAATRLAPPVIHETFTRLACPKNQATTVAIQACAEKTVLGTDRVINERVKMIFRLLPSPERRVQFVDGERAFLRYRHAQCTSEATAAGGTQAPIQYAYCVIANNRQHILALAALRSVLPRH